MLPSVLTPSTDIVLAAEPRSVPAPYTSTIAEVSGCYIPSGPPTDQLNAVLETSSSDTIQLNAGSFLPFDVDHSASPPVAVHVSDQLST